MSNVAIQPPLSNETELAPDSGLVILQVADTTVTGRFYPVNQVTFAARDVNVEEAKLPRILAAEKYANSTALFVAALPAKEYAINSVRSFHRVGDASFSRFYPGDIELGTFTVEPGKVTDLGTIAVYIERQGKDYTYATTRVSSNDHGQRHVLKTLPEVAGAANNWAHPRTWNDDGKAFERDNAYRRAANRQMVYGLPHLDENTSTLIYPSRLGMIVKRDKSGQWSLEAFDEDVELVMLTELGDQTVVVTEFGDVFSRGREDQPWQAVNKVPGGDKVVFLGQHTQLGVYALTQSANGVTLWSAPQLGDAWRRVNNLEPKLGFFASLDKSLLGLDQSISGASYLATENYLFLALRDSLYRYEFAVNEFVDLKTPKVVSLQARNGILTLSAQGFLASNQVSRDNGENWENYAGRHLRQFSAEENKRFKRNPGLIPKVRGAKFIGHPIFVNAQTAYGVHQPIKKGEPFLVKTENGATTWRAVDTPLPEGCSGLTLANESELLLRCFLSGEFYWSDDGGASWKIEREVSDT